MKTRTKTRQSRYNSPQSNPDDDHVCKWRDCEEMGEFKAPLSREELNSYQWFCLEHVRLYNKSWNYYDGMDDDEVERDKRHDTVWQRPSWKLGRNAGSLGPEHTIDPFDILGGKGPGSTSNSNNSPPVRPPITKDEEKAYNALGIDYPISEKDLKSRYKELVKAHHPDTNKGSKSSEEKIKKINQAYYILRESLKNQG